MIEERACVKCKISKPVSAFGVDRHHVYGLTSRCRACLLKPRKGPRALRPLSDRLWSRVDKSGGPDACWPWTGGRMGNGYAQLGRGRRGDGTILVHRLAFELAVGSTDGLCVCHRCDNPPCCNPAHLFLGTQKDNMRDASSKGRIRNASERHRGERHPGAKLTQSQVDDIRAECASGALITVVAERFGVNRSTVSLIARGKTWRAA